MNPRHPFADVVRILEKHCPPERRSPEPWTLTLRGELEHPTIVEIK